MSNNTGIEIKGVKRDDILKLDSIAQAALETLGIAGSFEATFAVADAMMQLRAAITPAMMEKFIALRDCKLGFMTDKNPRVWNKRENKYNEPYSPEVVKDCVIEATLRGVKTIGNQFNIITGTCYITKEGFEYKLKTLDGFSEFKPLFGVPQAKQGGALVECEATWKYKGVADSMKATIACKGDDYAGADSYVGKAQRKFYKRIFERLTGSSDPDGEADLDAAQLSDSPVVPPAEKRTPKFAAGVQTEKTETADPSAAQPPPESAPAASTEVQSADLRVVNADEQAEADMGLAPKTGGKKEKSAKAHVVQPELGSAGGVKPAEPVKSPQVLLEEFMTDAGVTFEKFRQWAGDTERLADADSYASWADLPSEFCTGLQKDAKSLSKCVTRCKS